MTLEQVRGRLQQALDDGQTEYVFDLDEFEVNSIELHELDPQELCHALGEFGIVACIKGKELKVYL